MSLDESGDERSTVIFYDLVYLENFVLITRGFHPLDLEQCMCKVRPQVVLICLILYGFVIIILN